MSCCFEDSLHYTSPGHGDWGVVRIGMLVPESVQLFVCPSACGRHGAIGAMMQGFKDRLFYLYLSQSDIIEGYDDLIPDAVEEVLEVAKPYPKVFFIFVSCLDDLIGTDHNALLAVLNERHPEIRFRICHMNPITLGSKTPPPVSIQNNLYSLLEQPLEKDDGVNSIGNLVSVTETSELYPFLDACGVSQLRHISQYKTFADYQEMAKSGKNLVLFAPGRQAAEQMKKRLGTPCLFIPATYDISEIAENYLKIGEFITGCPVNCPELERYKAQALKDILEAKEIIGDLPVIIDASATAQPFGLALALLSYGFNVVRVESQDCMQFDRDHLSLLESEYPQVQIYQPEHHKSLLFDRRLPDSLAIGVEGAYLSGSRYVADLFNDNGWFGYDGISRLMYSMTNAVKNRTNLKKIIDEYGLVI